MRPLPLLLLLSTVPAGAGGCPPCPRGVPAPCDSRSEYPNAPSPSPAEEPPEEPCPPCPPCAPSLPLPEGSPPAPPGDIIPLYCALLAALVLGLLAYVAFKCWAACRRKRQLLKARDAADAAEKLRGDGGVCAESAGPEAPQPPPAGGPAGGPAVLPVSPRRREEPGELERLLELGAPGAPGDVTSAV